MRRSEWRARADDPRSLFGWWWRGIVEEDRFLGFQSLAMLSALTLWFAGVQWAFAPTAITYPLWSYLRRRKTLDRLSELLPEPAPEDQFRASVAYRRKGLTTGTDVVALTFVHGWLHAEGVRSGFSLRAEDVRHPPSWSDRAGCLVLSDESEIRLDGLDYEARAALAAWSRAGERVQGSPTLPPATVHRAQFARWGAYIAVGLAAWFASSWLGKTGDGWAVALPQGLWFLGLAFVLFAGDRIVRLNEIHEEAKKTNPGEMAPIPLASPAAEGHGEEVRAEAQRVRRS